MCQITNDAIQFDLLNSPKMGRFQVWILSFETILVFLWTKSSFCHFLSYNQFSRTFAMDDWHLFFSKNRFHFNVKLKGTFSAIYNMYQRNELNGIYFMSVSNILVRWIYDTKIKEKWKYCWLKMQRNLAIEFASLFCSLRSTKWFIHMKLEERRTIRFCLVFNYTYAKCSLLVCACVFLFFVFFVSSFAMQMELRYIFKWPRFIVHVWWNIFIFIHAKRKLKWNGRKYTENISSIFFFNPNLWSNHEQNRFDRKNLL